MTHHCNNIDICTQFVAQMLDFRQSGANPEGLHRAMRAESPRKDVGKAGDFNSHHEAGIR
jgi:hypothetical protein